MKVKVDSEDLRNVLIFAFAVSKRKGIPPYPEKAVKRLIEIL